MGFPPQGLIPTIVTIALLTGAGLFSTANTWTSAQTFIHNGLIMKNVNGTVHYTVISNLNQTSNVTAQIPILAGITNFTMNYPQNYTSDAGALRGITHGCTWYDNTVNSTARLVCTVNGGTTIKVLAKA